jgi:haloalkane dehalogenase
MTIEAVRTPDEQFRDLPGFPYPPHYLDDIVDGLRMAYVDEGPADAPVVLCLHGEPTWSYLYRKMIPVFLEAGHRVVAPDLLGFGRSDKPVRDADYSFDLHRASLLALVDALELQGVTLVVQDWGGLLGLTLPVDRPELVSRLLVMNTGLGVGTEPSPGFLAWREFMANTADLDVAALMGRAVAGLSEAEAAAYAAPFPGPEYKAGVRTFPQLVPTSPDAPGVPVSRAAAAFWSRTWQGPTFMAIGEQDPILGPPVMEQLRALINGCPEPLLVAEGHFVQESGAAIARAALAAWGERD